MIAAAKGITTFDSRPWLAQIQQPTLIIAEEVSRQPRNV
jgi:hypothetical protein